MENRRIGAYAFIIGVLGQALQVVPNQFVTRWIDNGVQVPQWAPTFGTAGETVTVYRYIMEITGPAVTLALAIGLGYYVGTRLDLSSEYRRFIKTVAVGSTVGVVFPWIAVLWYSGSVTFDAFGSFVILATFVQQFVQVALVIILGAFAGAAFIHFQTHENQPPQPVEAETPDSSNQDDASTEDTDGQAQPTR